MPKFAIHRDPRLFIPRRDSPPAKKLALGLDLGTTTGVAYCFFDPGEPVDLGELRIHLGQWDLSPGEHGTNPIRFVRLRRFLEAADPDIVFFEGVKNTPTVGGFKKMNVSAIVARAATAAMMFGAYMATVSAWCEEREVPCDSVPISTIKRRATNRGNASKEDVIRACNATFGVDFDVEDYATSGVDNMADAAFCLLVGLEAYANGVV